MGILVAFIFDGAAQNDIVQFSAWVAFAVTLSGIMLQWIGVWAAWNDAIEARQWASATGITIIVTMAGLGATFFVVAGMFTWFAMLLVIAIPGYLVAARNSSRLETRRRAR